MGGQPRLGHRYPKVNKARGKGGKGDKGVTVKAGRALLGDSFAGTLRREGRWTGVKSELVARSGQAPTVTSR